ncbi:hypothetical protein [Ornithinimicrobium panacihumi]|uniref:hypothetical protein n=1 Tax=Ornithinimicrobium panacihumi TaxID=2008449 RepID=UPI003F8B8F18
MGNGARYELNYDWSRLGPTRWDEGSIVTLEVDLESYDEADALRAGIERWWRVETEGRLTLWLVSHGQDAFDTIAHYADEVYEVALHLDPSVRIVWTELPHEQGASDGVPRLSRWVAGSDRSTT